jgi:cystathionine gamma-synthase
MQALLSTNPAAALRPATNPIRAKSQSAKGTNKCGGAKGCSTRLVVRAGNNGEGMGWSDSTQAVHNGERGGRPRVSDSLTTPVCMTSTYWFKDTEELIAYQEGRYGSFEYGRYGNPTARACEEKIRLLEGGEDCLLSASGMNTAVCMLLALVPAGGHIVTTTDCYRRTRQFVQTFMPKMGISCTVLDPSDYDGLEAALAEHECALYFSESPTNPYLRCVDIERIAKLCKPSGCLGGAHTTCI